MNNNYNTAGRLNDNIYLQLMDKKYETDSSSSDSEFSDGFDGRLDEEFNRLIKEQKLNLPTENVVAVEMNGNEEIQDVMNNNPTSIPYNSSLEPIFTENNVAVDPSILVKEEPIDICSSDEQDILDISASIVDESNVLEPIISNLSTKNGLAVATTSVNIMDSSADSISIEQDEANSTFHVEPSESILHSTARHSMLPQDGDLDANNWTDCESDVNNVTYNDNDLDDSNWIDYESILNETNNESIN